MRYGCGTGKAPLSSHQARASATHQRDMPLLRTHLSIRWGLQTGLTGVPCCKFETSPQNLIFTLERAYSPGYILSRMLKSEQAVLDAGGCVVRLVGLYHANR